jgi:hypothetical protein
VDKISEKGNNSKENLEDISGKGNNPTWNSRNAITEKSGA